MESSRTFAVDRHKPIRRRHNLYPILSQLDRLFWQRIHRVVAWRSKTKMKESSLHQRHKRRRLAILATLWSVQGTEAFVPLRPASHQRPLVVVGLDNELPALRSPKRIYLSLSAITGESSSGNLTSINTALSHVVPPGNDVETPDTNPSRETESISQGGATSLSVSSELPTLLREVDVLYGRSRTLLYDPIQERFVQQSERKHKKEAWTPAHFLRTYILPQLSVAFLPAGVTSNYYRFMRWRVLQRFVNANLHVFGTQSLLMGLGIKSSASQLGALSAALKWVLKDALGKIVRMAWASQMGRRFDSDAKRWRFRSAFIFAAGNFLEITTYMFPSMFLVWATLANCCKQMSMLTSSSTRTALYNSFRDGTRENIGDITAKGEAQIAIVDLLGIASGVCLSRTVGTSVQRIVAVYFLLQSCEILCMYRQLRAVVYRVLNFERMMTVIQQFAEKVRDCPETERRDFVRQNGGGIPTPAVMASRERIFLPPPNLARRANAFGSLGRARLSPTELQQLMQIFKGERFLLVAGPNIKHSNGISIAMGKSKKQKLQENCHIVLHTEATNVDIVKSTLALTLLRNNLAARSDELNPDTLRSSDCMDLIAAAQQEADELFPPMLRQLSKQGWESPARFMFGRVHMRAEWPLPPKKTPSKTPEL
eukprot:scaffold7101_cov153-Amphora_coffeaeformis.AAC.6